MNSLKPPAVTKEDIAIAKKEVKAAITKRNKRRKEQRASDRREWLKAHIFDIVNLIIAVVALVISVLGLLLP